MSKNYKLYPVNRYSLLSVYYSDEAELYEGYYKNGYERDLKEVMTIHKSQCTRIVRRYGKDYYKILIGRTVL